MTTIVLKMPKLARHAKRIATACRCDVIRRHHNPTLVHHGLAKAARWHVVTEGPPREAVADIYALNEVHTTRVARLLASVLGVPLVVLDNAHQPADLKSHPRKFIAGNPSRSRAAREWRRVTRLEKKGGRTAAERFHRQGSRIERLGRRITKLQAERLLRANPKGRNSATKGLPPTWVWTRKMYGQDRMLWAARDTRWAPNVPDLVSTSESDVIRQAKEIDKYGPHGRSKNPHRWEHGDKFVLTIPYKVERLNLKAGETGFVTLVVDDNNAYAQFDNHPHHHPVPINLRWLTPTGGKVKWLPRKNPSRSAKARAKRKGLRAAGRVLGKRWLKARMSPQHGRGSAKVQHYFEAGQARGRRSAGDPRPNPKGPEIIASYGGRGGAVNVIRGDKKIWVDAMRDNEDGELFAVPSQAAAKAFADVWTAGGSLEAARAAMSDGWEGRHVYGSGSADPYPRDRGSKERRRNPSRSKGAKAGRKAKRRAFRSRRVYRAAVRTHRTTGDARPGALARFGHFEADSRARDKRRIKMSGRGEFQRTIARLLAEKRGHRASHADDYRIPRMRKGVKVRVLSGPRNVGKVGTVVSVEPDSLRVMVRFGRSRTLATHYVHQLASITDPRNAPNPKGRKTNPVGDAFKVGDRVQLHAATDEWMQGDRYGVVVGFGRAREYTDRFSPGGRVMAKPVRVKLDKSGRVRRFHPDNLFIVEGNPKGRQPSHGQMALFERFTFTMPLEAAREMSGPGPADDAVEYWAGRVHRPAGVTPEKLAAELKEYGAWDADQLADDDENWKRILWIGATSIMEDLNQSNPRRRNPKGLNHAARTAQSVRRPRGTGARRSTAAGAKRRHAAGGQHHGTGARVAVGRARSGRFVARSKVTRQRSRRAVRPRLAAGVSRRVNPSRQRLRSRVTSRHAKAGPANTEIKRAVGTFQTWQDRRVRPALTQMRNADPPLKRVAVELGELVSVTYRSDKYNGRVTDYEHDFKQPYASLVTDPDGRGLHVVRNRSRFKVTADGLVN